MTPGFHRSDHSPCKRVEGAPCGCRYGKRQHFQWSLAARRGPPSVQRPAIMSRERTSVIGIVRLRCRVTAAALVGGWLAASRYLGVGQQTVTAAHEDPPAAPAPLKKTARASRNDGGRAGQPDGAAKNAGLSDASVAVKKDTAAHDTNEPVSTTPPAADPQPDAAPARAAAETPLPSTAVASRTAATTENHTDARAIVEESQRRSEARFYQYRRPAAVLRHEQHRHREAVGVRPSRLARTEQIGVAIHGAARGQGRGAADLQPSRTRLRSVDVDARHRARPPHRLPGSIDAVLRDRLHVRGSRRA